MAAGDANEISGFDVSKFYVDTSGFSNSLNGGDLYLDFTAATVTAVPEPANWAMLLAGVAMMAGVKARQRRRAGD